MSISESQYIGNIILSLNVINPVSMNLIDIQKLNN